MEVTLEAIIAIVSLVVGLPPALFMLWRCCRCRRHRRTEEHRLITPTRLASFDTLPRDEHTLWPQSRSPVRVWTFIGYQMDLMHNQPDIFPLRQTRESSGRGFGHLRGGNS
ncbi:hypothetical protein CT0861_03348 [Colletotrichum tofieldiae]|uniref:Uncharacterized protein n=1 Tax=Colletotrichum tofieldiae TaxID=708197 RepID=A0A166XQT4_9PEZI|nr:hypothetical protein CT0861_03348 [Colletotrichum tofieldiae]